MGGQASADQRMEYTGMKLAGRLVTVTLLASVSGCSSGATTVHVVCATAADGCDFVGNRALQAAVDSAADGDRIRVRAGRYVAEGFRDIPAGDITVRAYVLVENKELDIVAEEQALLSGGEVSPSTAIVVAGGKVRIEGLAISGFFTESPDDQIYDGHGIFVISGSAHIVGVTLRSIEKMSVSVFGNSEVTLENCEVLDGHVGVWAEHESRTAIRDCVFRNNDSAGVAAYVSSAVTVSGTLFEDNLDDGIYAADQASVAVADSAFIRNRPYAVRSVDDANISVSTSKFRENEQDRFVQHGE